MREPEYRLQIIDYRLKHFIIVWNECVEAVHKHLDLGGISLVVTHRFGWLHMLVVQKWGVFALRYHDSIPLKIKGYAQEFKRIYRLPTIFIPTIHKAYKNKDKLNLDKYIIERIL